MSEDWPLHDFPHPNPYFPEVPRTKISHLLWIGLVLCIGGLPGTIAAVVAGHLEPALAGWIIVLGFFASGFGLYSLVMYRRRVMWSRGEIVPAIIESGANGPPRQDAVMSFLRLLAPPIALLVAIADRNIRTPDSAYIKYVSNGQLKRRRIKMGQHWKLGATGKFIWIHPRGRLMPWILPWIAPRDQAHQSVPEEAKRWLQSAIKESEHFEDRELVKELQKAAKANTKALKRSTRYQKRPD
jgi:hypothetical protein